MTADELLSRLHKVRRTGHDEWVACCPHHADKSPSLAVKQAAGDVVLLHCFAGCSTDDVLGSLGLTFADIMPPKEPLVEVKRLPFNPRTVLEAIAINVRVLALMANDVAKGAPITPADRDKFFDVAAEILEAIDYATR